MNDWISRTWRDRITKYMNKPHEKEQHMAKKPVLKFTLGDGPKPIKVTGSGRIQLRLPMPGMIRPNIPVLIRLGVTADTMLIVTSNKIELTKFIFAPGEEIVLNGMSKVSDSTELVGGETIAYATPLFVPEFDIE